MTDVIRGDPKIPPVLRTFCKTLITSDGARSKKEPLSIKKERRVKLLTEDAIFAVINGEVKSSKHLLLLPLSLEKTHYMTPSGSCIKTVSMDVRSEIPEPVRLTLQQGCGEEDTQEIPHTFSCIGKHQDYYRINVGTI